MRDHVQARPWCFACPCAAEKANIGDVGGLSVACRGRWRGRGAGSGSNIQGWVRGHKSIFVSTERALYRLGGPL